MAEIIYPHEQAAHCACGSLSETGNPSAARLVLVSAERIHGPADLETEPPIPVDGFQGLWAAALRPR